MTKPPDSTQRMGGEVFLVGDLRVDIGRQLVTRGETEVELPNLSMRMLVALIQEAPNVVSIDRLMDLVWPSQVVSPETINKRANLLREALGDNTKESRYIAGVRGRGYRLVAAVARAAPDIAGTALPAPPESKMPVTTPKQPSILQYANVRSWRFGLLVLAGVLVASGLAMRWVLHRTPVGPQPATAQAAASLQAVAVLAFENLSADADDAFLSRGVPEMILNRLSQMRGLAVIARDSSFAMPAKGMNSQQIGRRLNAAYLVNGSVQREARRLRLTVQLVDAGAGTLLWSAKFDRALDDIFSAEDEIADQVATALSARMGGFAIGESVSKHTANTEAYLDYLRGRALLGRFSVAESDAAIPFFERAIALDPGFAASYASLYDARMQAANQRHENLEPVRQRYRPLIEKALALDPGSGEAYFARAMWSNATVDARRSDYVRGATLSPSDGRGLTSYAEFLAWEVERPQEAAPVLQHALQVDPMSPQAHFDAAMMGFNGNGADAAEQSMVAVLELDPQFVPAIEEVGLYRWLFHGKLAEAIQILEHAIALDPLNPTPRHTAMAVYLDLEDVQAARAVAAGTAQSAQSSTLLALYDGDWRTAGPAAYRDIRWGDDCQNWLEGAAIRDYALKTGDVARAISFMKKTFYLESGPTPHMDVCAYHVASSLPVLLEAEGHKAEAQRWRDAFKQDIDTVARSYGGDLPRVRAELLLLDGHRDQALEALAEDFHGGDIRQWWYTLKFNPLWRPLHGDPRFQAIANDIRIRVDLERRQLEEMRRLGTVPNARRASVPARVSNVR